MENIAFFSESRGYFEIEGTPSAEFLKRLPKDTQKVPLKPGSNYLLVDGEWVEGPPPPTPTIEQAREQAKAAMLAWINDFLHPFTASAAQAEPLAWATKEEAARAYPNGTPEQTAMIEVEASVTGEQPAALCAIIIGQADLYRTIISFTTGLRRKTVAQIDAADLADIPGILDAAKVAAIAKAQELGVA